MECQLYTKSASSNHCEFSNLRPRLNAKNRKNLTNAIFSEFAVLARPTSRKFKIYPNPDTKSVLPCAGLAFLVGDGLPDGLLSARAVLHVGGRQGGRLHLNDLTLVCLVRHIADVVFTRDL